MNRRSFLATSTVLPAAAAAFSQTTPATTPKTTTDVPKTPPLAWHNPEEWGLEGRTWLNLPRKRFYDRFPEEAHGKVPAPVWDLSRHSTGMATRFKTNATMIYVRYKLLSASLAMPHMPATGASGVDLYARDSEGKWRWVNVTRPDKQELEVQIIQGMPAEDREYLMYLPLFNGVDKLEIGVPKDRAFERLKPRDESTSLLFYGTSITHGACASRPGMCHPAILGRRFDRPVINLGFSGNGKMDKEVGDLLIKVNPAVFVIDCSPNMAADLINERCIPLIEQIRAARPETPIVLVEDRRNTNSWTLPARYAHHTANHAALKASYEKLLTAGVKNLHYIEGDHLLGDDADGATDGSHPSDLGYFRQADVMEPIIRKALGQA